MISTENRSLNLVLPTRAFHFPPTDLFLSHFIASFFYKISQPAYVQRFFKSQFDSTITTFGFLAVHVTNRCSSVTRLAVTREWCTCYFPSKRIRFSTQTRRSFPPFPQFLQNRTRLDSSVRSSESRTNRSSLDLYTTYKCLWWSKIFAKDIQSRCRNLRN